MYLSANIFLLALAFIVASITAADTPSFTTTKDPPAFVIGAMKSGSSALWDLLRMHEDIRSPQTVAGDPAHFERLHYFNDPALYESKGIADYDLRMSLPSSLDGKLRLVLAEASGYLQSSNAPFNIQRAYGDKKPKFIAILRDPVERSLSLYSDIMTTFKKNQHNKTESLPSGYFDNILMREMKNYDECRANSLQNIANRKEMAWKDCIPTNLSPFSDIIYSSLYDQHFRFWNSAFSDDNFCILESTFFDLSPNKALDLVVAFLGLAPYSFPTLDGYESQSKNYTVNDTTLAAMQSFFERHGTFQYDYVSKHQYRGCRPPK